MQTSASGIIIEDIKRVHVPTDIVVREARGMFRLFLAFQKHLFLFSAAFILSLPYVSTFVAFEAHKVDVKAEIARLDAPVINHSGGIFTEPVEVMIKSSDPDVSFVYYVILAGDDPDAVVDPSCASALGGTNPQGPITISFTSVAKAIACVGDTPESPHGPVTTEIYTFIEQETEENNAGEPEVTDTIVPEEVSEETPEPESEPVPEELPPPVDVPAPTPPPEQETTEE